MPPRRLRRRPGELPFCFSANVDPSISCPLEEQQRSIAHINIIYIRHNRHRIFWAKYLHSPQLRRQMKCRRFFALGDSLSHAALSRCAGRLSGGPREARGCPHPRHIHLHEHHSVVDCGDIHENGWLSLRPARNAPTRKANIDRGPWDW